LSLYPGDGYCDNEAAESSGVFPMADHANSIDSTEHLFHAPSARQKAPSPQAAAEGVTDALKASEMRYRRLFETARDGILILDSETGKITDANPFMEELLGYSHEEFLSKELWEIGDRTAARQGNQSGSVSPTTAGTLPLTCTFYPSLTIAQCPLPYR
jgi:PAS domain-containing protein